MALGRILVVDDEAPVREVLTEYFGTEGYEVESAATGLEALSAVRGGRVDLVLLDVRMPGLDGVQVLRTIRELADGLPVIMVTANEDVGLARETLRLGAFDYVAKPFDFDYLDRAVAAGLAARMTTKLDGSTKGDGPMAANDEPWKRLIHAVFRVARAMGPTARTSTGERLEAAALAAARDGAAGRDADADEHLAEVARLLDLAAELGDLPAADRALVESAVEAARRSFAARR
jgi:two-component system, response regulator, stage 0 sporulation protein F